MIDETSHRKYMPFDAENKSETFPEFPETDDVPWTIWKRWLQIQRSVEKWPEGWKR